MGEERRSIWRDTASLPTPKALAGDREADVVVVGAGITGLTAAFLLERLGRSVVVLDQSRLGATASSTGHLTALVDTGYRTIEQTFGVKGPGSWPSPRCPPSTGWRCWHTSCTSTVRSAGCLLLYAEQPTDAAIVEQELEAARRAGLTVSLTRSVPLPVQHRTRRCVPSDTLVFHPAAYLAGLARALGRMARQSTRGRRPHCFGRSALRGGDRERDAARPGRRARQPYTGRIQTSARATRASSLLCLGGEAQGGPPDGLFFDTASPYHCLRQLRTPSGTWLIVGGFDQETGHASPNQAYRELEAYTRQRFPVAAVDYLSSSR